MWTQKICLIRTYILRNYAFQISNEALFLAFLQPVANRLKFFILPFNRMGKTSSASTFIANPFAKANNPEVEGYDPQRPTSYIQLVDCNNQYGWAMGQFLPTHKFEWLSLDTENPEFCTNFVSTQSDAQEDGFFFEVDPDYPSYLHDQHDNFPLPSCPSASGDK